MYKPKNCFYVPGSSTIIDTATINDTGHFSGETLEEVRKRYPGAELMDLDKACQAIERQNTLHYEVGKATETTAENFTHMLEVLPPRYWKRTKEGESFQMCELETGNITSCFVRIGKRYFWLYHYLGTPHAELVECCQAVA